MRFSLSPARPYSVVPSLPNYDVVSHVNVNMSWSRKCRCVLTLPSPTISTSRSPVIPKPEMWEGLLLNQDHNSGELTFSGSNSPVKLNRKWKEYQGLQNWEGLLDPLDDNLRGEILRYGQFVESAYQSFDFDPSSPTYATCQFPRNTLLDQSGLPNSGYRVTKNLRATSGINLPRWIEKAPSWMATQSSWIGYVAVCQDKDEISRLGRRDVVISFRGTATCLEWLENLRATLTHLPDGPSGPNLNGSNSGPMVESGFLSLYTSGAHSLRDMVREEISRLLQSYGDEPLSLTITGHSLGAAIATLAAYDIKTTFKRAPMVTVMSFGGPRVGNRCFRKLLEKQGTKVLRIVNSDDVITKVPGVVLDNREQDNVKMTASMPSWIQKRVEETPWVYAEVGKELRLSSRDSPYLNGINVATCHELKTYLHLVDGFVSSTCPFRETARRVLHR
ncbi:alpha/beta-Hydrolases superfamily protein [Raphanus sativus]|uniref:Phospholipase A(1) DAD1, chloroplastic n=1 Tax=Raphanus sativus TaxID=3726 RepID=A0A6J0LUE0_RAPSA|nr:phospholipase A(1) DAD1, chloroplastic [Raphanus sativus]KAJ4892336.1 alpha/beta-Hydrolases superfamily protein [Raphanus sativus]